MAFRQITNGASPMQQQQQQQQQQHPRTVPSVHVVHRFPELSSFLMLQHHGHPLDFRPGPRVPYQSCLSQPVSLAHLDNMNSVVPTCQLINALPCHGMPSAPYPPIVSCQPCSVQTSNHPVTAQPVAQPASSTATVTSPSELQHENVSATFAQPKVPHSPPPPTRKILVSRKRSASGGELGFFLEPKVPRRDTGTINKIEFRPLPPATVRRHARIARFHAGRKPYQNVQISNNLNLVSAENSSKLGTNMPYKFEFNIPLPEIPKEKAPLKIANADALKKSKNEISEKYQKTWSTEPVPKLGYISVLEQAINQLSERCMEDAKEVDTCDSNKENEDNINTPNEHSKDAVTKESLDSAWLTVLDKVFGKSGEQHGEEPHGASRFTHSSSGTSGYPSEYYSEVDWTTSTLESDCVSSAEQEPNQDGESAEGDNFSEHVPQHLQISQENRREASSTAPSEHSGSRECCGGAESNNQEETAKTGGTIEDSSEEQPNDHDEVKGDDANEDDDYSDEDEDDIRDEQEEEKATDADVETEFMSSAEHERPKWAFLKPRLLKRLSPKKILNPFRKDVESDASSGKEGFVTPTYQCNFPTSSDSETTQGNCTPSHARKPQPPFKSPEPVDPSFRGVTVQIRTKVEKDQVQLSIKGFFNCRKKSKQRSEYSTSNGTKSSSDSDSNSNSDVYRKRKRRSYQSGKQCASCCTKKTPLWRDAEDGTPLCNACGIRYKKYRIKCHSCWNIPRKDVKMNSTCANCGENLRLSAMRNPAKLWT